MKNTFKTANGATLIVEPSPTRGYVWITQAAHAGEPARNVAIPLHLAGVVAQAIEANATLIEEACLPAWPLGCSGNCQQGRRACDCRKVPA